MRTYCRVYISERFKPKALMRMRTCPSVGFGIGHCCILMTSGPPISCITAAFIVVAAARAAMIVEMDGLVASDVKKKKYSNVIAMDLLRGAVLKYKKDTRKDILYWKISD